MGSGWGWAPAEPLSLTPQLHILGSCFPSWLHFSWEHFFRNSHAHEYLCGALPLRTP